MPVTACESNGQPGYKWGESGHCYTYEAGDAEGAANAKRRAFVQGLAAGETQKMASNELDAARALAEHIGVRLTKDATGSLIIAWYPAATEEGRKLASAIAMPGGEAVDDLHLTLLYLGDPMQYDITLIGAALKIWTATSWWYPLEGVIGGSGRFVGEGDQDVLIALPDIPGLDDLRRSLCECLCSVGCFVPEPASTGHGYTPHITLAYVPRSTPSPTPYPETIPLTVDNITVAAGATRASFEIPEPADVNGADMGPYLAERAAKMVEKAGRVLSGKNQKLVQNAHEALQALLEAAQREKDMPAEDETQKAIGEEDEGALEYIAVKAAGREADRYTFGPLYAPDRKDAHGEWTDAETLQKAVWDYVRSSADNGRRINLQHEDSGQSTVGEWVEVCSWPYETEITVKAVGGEDRTLTMPAGTVYMGVVWDEKAWEQGITKGVLNGYSLGGRAMRVAEGDGSMGSMGDKLAAKDPKKPYGDVEYADPGYQEDGKKRYPLDSEEHVRSAWSYIHQADNRTPYTPEQLKSIESRIRAAGKDYGITFEDTQKAGWHEYKGEADGACATCGKAFKDGMHIGNGAEGDPAKDAAEKAVAALQARHAAQLEAIREAVIEDEKRHEAELAKARAEGAAESGERSLSLVERLVEKFTGQKQPDVHVHLPEQNVTINEVPVEDG